MAEDPDPRTDITDAVARARQDVMDKHGWDGLTEEQITTQVEAHPAVIAQREKDKIEGYRRKVGEAFDTALDTSHDALNQRVIVDMQKLENDVEAIDLETQVKGTVPNGPGIVTTERNKDFEMLLGIVMSEKQRREAIPWDDWVRIPRRSEGREEKSLRTIHYEYHDRILHHEPQHAEAYKGKITDPKTGEPVDDEVGIVFGFQVVKPQSGNRFDIVPFTTYNGQVRLHDLIEATAAPEDLSRADRRVLELHERRLKNAGLMLSGESIFNPNDRERMYERKSRNHNR